MAAPGSPPSSSKEEEHIFTSPRPRVKVPLSDPQPLRRSGPLGGGRTSSSWRRSSVSGDGPASPRPVLRPLPPLAQAVPEQRADLFVQKVRQCRVVFDFGDPFLDVEEKEIKRQVLKELSAFATSSALRPDAFTDPATYAEVFSMVAVNLFRPLAPNGWETTAGSGEAAPVYDPEDDEPVLEDAWPHLRLVYKLLLIYLESPALKVALAARVLPRSWVQQLLFLFTSGDPRERTYAKTALHRLYGRFVDLRLFIRYRLSLIFTEFAFGDDKIAQHHPGIADLLEVLGTIIHGFAQPLKEEHSQFLVRALLPLHKTSSAAGYYPQLAYCIYQYLDKQPSLAPTIFGALLRYWPVVNSPKELMFLSEVEELLTIAQVQDMSPIVEPLFRRLATCMASLHFQVAEKALCMWRKKQFVKYRAVKVARRYLPRVLPPVWKALDANATHWHKVVRAMSLSLLRELAQMDPDLAARCRASSGGQALEPSRTPLSPSTRDSPPL